MKKFICIILATILILNIVPINTYARAGGGGGGSGGSGGSGGGGSSSGGSKGHYSSSPSSPFASLISMTLFFGTSIFIIYLPTIAIKLKVTKAKKYSIEKIKGIEQEDIKWNYEELIKHVEESYYIIQEAWTTNDFSKAKKYMDPNLLENFQIKLNWMEYNNQKNIMDKIELLEAYPVSLYDSIVNTEDTIWFYIKGKMVDYIVNTDNYSMKSGSTSSKSFIEYWQFKRNKKDIWVLTKILQEDEIEKIAFEEKDE